MSTRNKAVAQYEGKTLLAKYSSISYAAYLTETQPAHIGKVANGLRNTAGGYVWNFTGSTKRLSKNVPGVLQIDNDTDDIVAVYRDVDTASNLSGFSSTKINNVLSGVSKTVSGYRFLAV